MSHINAVWYFGYIQHFLVETARSFTDFFFFLEDSLLYCADQWHVCSELREIDFWWSCMTEREWHRSIPSGFAMHPHGQSSAPCFCQSMNPYLPSTPSNHNSPGRQRKSTVQTTDPNLFRNTSIPSAMISAKLFQWAAVMYSIRKINKKCTHEGDETKLP